MSYFKRVPIVGEDEPPRRWLVRQWQRVVRWLEVPQLDGAAKSYAFSLDDDMSEYRAEQAERKRRWPIRWLLSETIPDFVEDAWNYGWKNPKDWVRFRTWDRYDRIRIHSLSPNYYDKDTIMLHGMFDLLVDFVEIELASMNFTYWESNGNKRPRRRTRSVEAGVNYLEWESQNTLPQQQEAARIKLELYTWWTVVRPQRVEPWSWHGIWPHDSEGKRIRTPGGGELASYLDHYYDQEDQEMLKRLVDIRFSLWT